MNGENTGSVEDKGKIRLPEFIQKEYQDWIKSSPKNLPSQRMEDRKPIVEPHTEKYHL